MLVALVISAGAAGITSGPVLAHAQLDRAEPAVDSEVRESPGVLRLYFTQALVPRQSWVILRDATGKDTELPTSIDMAEPKVMRAHINEPLKPGVYTVRWQTLSAEDDDFAQDSYKLTVLNPDGSRPSGGFSAVADSGEDGGGSSATMIVVAAVVGVLVGGGFWLIRRRQAS